MQDAQLAWPKEENAARSQWNCESLGQGSLGQTMFHREETGSVRTLGKTEEHPFIWAVLIPRAAKPIRYAMLQKMRAAGTGPAHLFSFSSPLGGWYTLICTNPSPSPAEYYRNNRQMSPGPQERHYRAKGFRVFVLLFCFVLNEEKPFV